MGFGTNFTFDLLVGQFAGQTILEIGEQKVYDAIEDGFRVHARTTEEVFSNFADVRTETRPGDARYAVYGSNRIIRGRKVDQIGRVDAQKVKGGFTVGFPLYRDQFAIQWTEDFLEYATGADIEKDFNAARQGDVLDMRSELLAAIFGSTNRSETEMFYDRQTVEVKALVNADGMDIPIGPRGETFDGATHNHYLAINGITQAAVKNAIQTVKEHYERGRVYVYIPSTHETDVRAFSEFLPYVMPNIIPGIQDDRVRGTGDDMPLNDRAIGELDQSVIWVKPWMPTGYVFVHIVGPGIAKIARFRQRKSGLYLATKEASFPLRADVMQHDFGAGVYERTSGAILYTGGGAYVNPTFDAMWQ